MWTFDLWQIHPKKYCYFFCVGVSPPVESPQTFLPATLILVNKNTGIRNALQVDKWNKQFVQHTAG